MTAIKGVKQIGSVTLFLNEAFSILTNSWQF